MLSEKELDQNARQLADFQQASVQHQQNLSEVLEHYALLMENYKRLKSDYEEERDSRERYKQMARGQERNPFVLVLIDGDGYIFDNDLISGGADGGQRAAQLLNDAVKRSLRDRGLENLRIMVRVYANVAGLSKVLSRHKLCGPEKRALAPFTANFTRSYALFDFVDAGELKENADSKIRALFHQFADNAQCKHIFFAGCHDVGYVNDLQQYAGNRERFTLVKTPAFHQEFSKLGMRIEDFPSLFRTAPLDGQVLFQKPTPAKTAPSALQQPLGASGTYNNQTVCFFFQKGICKYGQACHHRHDRQPSTNGGSNSGPDVVNWRDRTSTNDEGGVPFQGSSLARSDHNYMSGNADITPTYHDPTQVQIDLATSLPQAHKMPPKTVPVNKYGHRLDTYTPPPSLADRAAFTARVSVQKLCNDHFLNGSCRKGQNCEYDHEPATPGIVNCLKQVVFNNPCPRKGVCRVLNCLSGHVCQKADCKIRGGKIYCKFGVPVHAQDLNVEKYVPAIVPRGGEVSVEESSEMAGSVSGQDHSPTLSESEPWAGSPMPGRASNRGDAANHGRVRNGSVGADSDEDDDIVHANQEESQGARLGLKDDDSVD